MQTATLTPPEIKAEIERVNPVLAGKSKEICLFDAFWHLSHPRRSRFEGFGDVDRDDLERQAREWLATRPDGTIVVVGGRAVYLDTTAETPRLVWLPAFYAHEGDDIKFTLRAVGEEG